MLRITYHRPHWTVCRVFHGSSRNGLNKYSWTYILSSTFTPLNTRSSAPTLCMLNICWPQPSQKLIDHIHIRSQNVPVHLASIPPSQSEQQLEIRIRGVWYHIGRSCSCSLCNKPDLQLQHSLQLRKFKQLCAAERTMERRILSLRRRIARDVRSLAILVWEPTSPLSSLPPPPLVERISFWHLYVEEPDRKLMAYIVEFPWTYHCQRSDYSGRAKGASGCGSWGWVWECAEWHSGWRKRVDDASTWARPGTWPHSRENFLCWAKSWKTKGIVDIRITPNLRKTLMID